MVNYRVEISSFIVGIFLRWVDKEKLKDLLNGLNHEVSWGMEEDMAFLETHYKDMLKTFLDYLRLMPAVVKGVNGKTIHSCDIPMEPKIVEILRNI